MSSWVILVSSDGVEGTSWCPTKGGQCVCVSGLCGGGPEGHSVLLVGKPEAGHVCGTSLEKVSQWQSESAVYLVIFMLQGSLPNMEKREVRHCTPP